MFCEVTAPRNSGKSAKSREIHKNTKIPRNSVEILSNTCLYNIFETSFSYRGYLLAINLQITETCKQRPETTRCRLCCEKLGTSHNVKGFATGSFLERLVVKEQLMTSARKTLKTLV